MAADRASIFGDAESTPALDVGGFTAKPKGKAHTAPDPQAVRSISEASDFPSRDPSAKPVIAKPQRRRRTGRNVQVNIKASVETVETLYRLSDRHGWTLGETLARALAVLEAERDSGVIYNGNRS